MIATRVARMDEAARTEEIARMLAGASITGGARLRLRDCSPATVE